MNIDRKLQLNILLALAEDYPQAKTLDPMPNLELDRHRIENLRYLQSHGLVSIIRTAAGIRTTARLTTAGLDFLENDGGIEAIRTLVRSRGQWQ